MFSNCTVAIKFDCVFLTIFQSFYLFVSFIFNFIYNLFLFVLKDDLNHYLVHASAFNGLKSAKNVVFSSFYILVDMPMAPPSPPGYSTDHYLYKSNIIGTRSTSIFSQNSRLK